MQFNGITDLGCSELSLRIGEVGRIFGSGDGSGIGIGLCLVGSIEESLGLAIVFGSEVGGKSSVRVGSGLERLRKSEIVLNRAQAMAKTGIFRFTLPDISLTWSEETYRIFELPIGAPVNERTILDFCVLGDLPNVTDALLGIYKKKTFDMEYRIRTKSGIKWLRARTELFYDKAGNPTEGIGMVQDVSDYRNALIMVGQRENFLNAIIDTSAEGFMLMYCNMTGFNAEELLGMRVTDIESCMGKNEIDRYIELCREKGKIRFETQYRRKDGGEIDVEVYATCVNDGIVLFCRDITERNRDRARLELLNFAMDHVADSAYLLDSEGKIVYANATACKCLGYDRGALLGMKVGSIDTGVHDAEFAEKMASLEKKKTVTVLSKHRRRNGSTFPVEISANHFFYDGDPFNLCLVRDITEQRNDAKIKQLADLASNITKELSNMVCADGNFELPPCLSEFGFSARQIEIVRHVIAGEPSKAIASDLGITEATVKTHLAIMYRRLRVNSRIEFCNYLVQKEIRIE